MAPPSGSTPNPGIYLSLCGKHAVQTGWLDGRPPSCPRFSRRSGFIPGDGQQCLETPTRIYKMAKGENLVIPTGVTMRLVVTGTKPRRALAVIVYDSSQPPTTRMEMEPLPKLASCK